MMLALPLFPRSRYLFAAPILGLAAVAALVGITHRGPSRTGGRQSAIAAAHAAPPKVEPLRFRPVPVADARAINAAVPVLADAGPAARPFRSGLADADASRAEDCLAAAGYFEAGDHADDERAVMQVVLNRVHHPAFPKTVCGVVFQGAERRTGCQFTFTCDGSMRRRTPSDSAWRRAETMAAAALAGAVFAPVGLATHYHADWVVPYWSSSLDRVARIGPHIFYRWAGWWGTPGAFRGGESGPEPSVGQLVALSTAPGMAGGAVQLADGTLTVHAPVRSVASAASDPDLFLVRLTGSANDYPVRAAQLCAGHDRCTVLGWTRAAFVARSLPLTPQEMDALAFRYVHESGTGAATARWDCAQARRPDPADCLHATLLTRAAPADTLDAAAAPAGSGLVLMKVKSQKLD